MSGQPGFFDLDERYRALSAAGMRWSGWHGRSTSSCSDPSLRRHWVGRIGQKRADARRQLT